MNENEWDSLVAGGALRGIFLNRAFSAGAGHGWNVPAKGFQGLIKLLIP